MAPQRQTPHRSRREIQEVRASELQEFRAENQKLRRENARLRRELEKYVRNWESSAGEEPAARPSPSPKMAAVEMSCMVCGSLNVVRAKFGSKTFVGCKDCKHKFAE